MIQNPPQRPPRAQSEFAKSTKAAKENTKKCNQHDLLNCLAAGGLCLQLVGYRVSLITVFPLPQVPTLPMIPPASLRYDTFGA